MDQHDRVTTKESYVELDIHSNPSRTEQQRKLDGSLEVGQLLGNESENDQCPVCGFYCTGNGGNECIDKPSLIAVGKGE